MKYMNKEKIILDLCGGTGAWSKPYKDAGYDVRVITLPLYDIMTFVPPKNVYGILSAPPCTMFSLARTTGKTPRDFKNAMLVVESCLRIVWEARINGSLKFWAIENPMGYLRQFLGKPAFTFDPSEFGADYNKKTDLWGYFNEPKIKLKYTRFASTDTNSRKLPSIPTDYIRDKNMRTQQIARSITNKDFAVAFYKANK